MSDRELRILAKEQIALSTRGADAELELQTREWLREFWTRSIVAWIALIMSAISLTVAICK